MTWTSSNQEYFFDDDDDDNDDDTDDDDDGDGPLTALMTTALGMPATSARLATEGERQRDRNKVHGPEPLSCPWKLHNFLQTLRILESEYFRKSPRRLITASCLGRTPRLSGALPSSAPQCSHWTCSAAH